MPTTPLATNLIAQADDLRVLKQPSIHSLTKIQAYGVVLVLDPDTLEILQASTNTSTEFGRSADNVVGSSLEDIFDPFQVDQIKVGLAGDNLDAINPIKTWVRRDDGDDYQVFDAVFHRSKDGFLVLELEPAMTSDSIPFLSFYHLARASINQLESTADLRAFCQVIVKEVRKVTGFDRVMLYQFDDDDHGEVLAEEKLAEMEPYLGLHFPESDIPQTARHMFLSNWIRVIPDAAATPVNLHPAENPVTGKPTDLTLSILRSPYPCHLEYLHNMEVASSMTISLMKDGRLWGLIACHHQTPKHVNYELRKACEFLGKVIFSEISTREEVADHAYQIQLGSALSSLIGSMAEADYFVDGLTGATPSLLDLAGASGAGVYFGGQWSLVGRTPAEDELNRLVQWLGREMDDDVFYADALPLVYADAHRFKAVASGLLAIPISKNSYILWFRPEVIQTVNWGGDPNHAYEVKDAEEGLKLSPRQSFSLWKETIQLTSLPWKSIEIQTVLNLRKAVVNIVLRQAEELAMLAQDLGRSNAELKKFAYVASHDLQEPLNQVANFVQLLEMRYGNKLDNDAKEFITFAVEGVSQMQTLIDDVLLYSKVDIQGVDSALVESEAPLKLALRNLQRRLQDTETELTYDPMPVLMADSTQLMQLFQNLVGNAIKFRRQGVAPRIHIGVERQEDNWLFSVQDNGIGLDTQFADRVFVIFQRLHTRDEYPGSGMGLAICKKIVDCHRGRIWIDSELTEGACFKFTLPVGGRDRAHARGAYKGDRTQDYFLGRG